MTTNTGMELTDSVITSIRYLKEMLQSADDGHHKTKVIDRSCDNLTKVIGSLDFDLTDATAAMKVVRENKSTVSYTHLTLPTKA